MLLVLLAVVPALGLILYTGLEQRRESAAEELQEALQLAQIASTNHQRAIEGTRSLLIALAQLPAVRKHDSVACSALFADILRRFPHYGNVGAVKPNGDIFCSGLPRPGPFNIADRPYFQRALQTRDFAASGYLIGRISGKPSLALAYPSVENSGLVRAVVYAGLDLSWFSQFAAQTRLPQGSVFVVIDHDGTILARYPDPERLVGKSVPEAPIVKTVLAQGEGVVAAPGLDGVPRLFGFTPLHRTPQGADAYVWIGIPKVVAYAKANRTLGRNLVGLGLVMVLSLLAASVGGNVFVLRSVDALVDATRRLAAGDLSVRTGLPHGQGELNQLAQAFDEMAAALEQREAERNRAVEILKNTEARFRELVESILDGIVMVDWEGRIQVVNKQTETLFGYTREELLGKPVEMLVPERFRNGHADHVKRYFADPHPRPVGMGRDLYGLRKDGSEFPVDISLSPLETEEGPLVTAAIRDIAERKRAEAARQALYQASLVIQEALGLQDRLTRLLHTAQTVFELDRVNILLADPEGKTMQVVASLGVEEPLEAIRVPIGPEGGALAEAYRTQQTVIWDGHAPLPEPLRLKPPYDQIKSLRSQAFALVPLVVQGRAIGVLGADREHTRRPLDATTLELLQLFAAQAALAIEHGRLFEEQRMAAIQLEARVEDRTLELQATNAELQEATCQAEAASRHKTEFLANMSHELRTPLNSILGFSQLLQDPTFGPLTAKQTRYLDNIHRSGQHLLALINDLLDLSKVEAGKLELRPEVFEPREALTAALSEIRPQAEAKRLQLQLQVDPALATLTADPLRFKQILFNLLSNAVKFTPDDGRVTVTARRVPSSEFHVPSSEPGTWDLRPGTARVTEFIELAVADTGIGIKAEDLSKLFQPFTQLESPFAKRHGGTGLGLALTKQLVELHEGQIFAASDGEGRGSTFTIRLPLGPRDGGAPDAPGPTPRPGPGG